MNIKNLKPTNENFTQGYYTIVNSEKYIGDTRKIIFRSSWERKFCIFCDNSERVIKWSSEPFPIQYMNPIDKKVHDYNIDFYAKMFDVHGVLNDYLVEIKPKSKLLKPPKPKKETLKQIKQYNYSVKEYIVNNAKFAAARLFAMKRGYKFIVLTEEFLFQ
jgi:hypothetical protein